MKNCKDTKGKKRVQHFICIPIWLNPPISPQVAGERYVYKFVCEPEALISLAFPDNQRPSLKVEFERYVNEEDTVPLSHLDDGVPYTTEQAPQNMGPQPYSKGYMY